MPTELAIAALVLWWLGCTVGIAVVAFRRWRWGAPGARAAAVGACVGLAVPGLLLVSVLWRTLAPSGPELTDGLFGVALGAAAAVSECVLAWAAVVAVRGAARNAREPHE